MTLVLSVSGVSSASPISPGLAETSSGPEVLPIMALHRHHGYVSFASKDGENFQLLVSIRADALYSYFPQFLDQLAKNSLVSLNGSHRVSSRKRDPVGYPWHRNESLRYLCACCRAQKSVGARREGKPSVAY
jgi:hypothetical protein